MTETVYTWKLHKFQAFSRIFCSVGLSIKIQHQPHARKMRLCTHVPNDQKYLTASLFIHETHIRYGTNKIVELIPLTWMNLMITLKRNVSQTKICPSFPWQDAWHAWPSDKWWSWVYLGSGMSSRQFKTMAISMISDNSPIMRHWNNGHIVFSTHLLLLRNWSWD